MNRMELVMVDNRWPTSITGRHHCTDLCPLHSDIQGKLQKLMMIKRRIMVMTIKLSPNTIGRCSSDCGTNPAIDLLLGIKQVHPR